MAMAEAKAEAYRYGSYIGGYNRGYFGKREAKAEA